MTQKTLKHKNHKLESKALYEIIRQFDHHIEVPHSIQHGDYNKFLTSFDGIKQIVKKYNDSSDSKGIDEINDSDLGDNPNQDDDINNGQTP